MRKIMLMAWGIAKNRARFLGGKASEYISYALKKAWAFHKHQLKMRKVYINKYIERFESTEEMAIATLTETGEYRELHDEDHINTILNNLARFFGV